MTLFENITQDLTTARKARDQARVLILSTIKGNLQSQAVMVEGVKVVSDEIAIAYLRKHMKGLVEIFEMRLSDENAYRMNIFEIDIIQSYLPKQLSEADLKYMLNGSGLSTMKDWMSWLKTNYAGQYDGKLASKVFTDWATS